MSVILLALRLTVVTGAFATLHVNEYPHNLGWLFGVGRKLIRNETTAPVCETEDCRIIAKILKESLNETVDPCDDFYEYVCGKWPENNPIPPGKDTWSFMKKVQDNLRAQVLGLLETDSGPKDVLSVKLAKRYYRTCTNHEGREKAGVYPLLAILNRIGGWPLTMEPDEWHEEMYSWQKVDDYFVSLVGENAFHRIENYSPYGSDEPEIRIMYPRFPKGMTRFLFSEDRGRREDNEEQDSDEKDSQEPGSKEDTLADESNEREKKRKTTPRQEYANLIAEVAVAIAETRGFDVHREKLSKDIDDMLDFMENLYMAATNQDSTKSLTLRDLHDWYNNRRPTEGSAKINWISKVEHLFSEANVEIDGNLEITIDTYSYFEQLRTLLQETPRRTIVNYIHWRFISDVMKYTNAKMLLLHEKIADEDHFSFLSIIMGEDVSGKCVEEAEMLHIISYMYVKRYFPNEIMEKAKEMLDHIQDEVREQILESVWLDEETKNFTLSKLKNMTKKIGYPSWYNNSTAVKNYYKGLVVGPSYFENALSYHRFKTWRRLRDIICGNEDRSMENMFFIPIMVNAMYSAFSNTIVITAADFQNPLFALLRPSVINFAIIGTIMGHEINHGFDDSNFVDNFFLDDTALMKWWNSMKDLYKERVECFVDQFNNYTDGNSTSRTYGRRTRNENIADTMGLEATLGGYYRNRKEEKNKPALALPGLENFSTEQLFFLSFAIMHCEVVNEATLERKKYDVHSSGRLRVIGPISNSENFAKSFNCPAGSPMNPKKKCNIWN